MAGGDPPGYLLSYARGLLDTCKPATKRQHSRDILDHSLLWASTILNTLCINLLVFEHLFFIYIRPVLSSSKALGLIAQSLHHCCRVQFSRMITHVSAEYSGAW